MMLAASVGRKRRSARRELLLSRRRQPFFRELGHARPPGMKTFTVRCSNISVIGFSARRHDSFLLMLSLMRIILSVHRRYHRSFSEAGTMIALSHRRAKSQTMAIESHVFLMPDGGVDCRCLVVSFDNFEARHLLLRAFREDDRFASSHFLASIPSRESDCQQRVIGRRAGRDGGPTRRATPAFPPAHSASPSSNGEMSARPCRADGVTIFVLISLVTTAE